MRPGLRTMIVQEHSKAQMLRIVHWVGDDRKRFDELISLFLSGEWLISQRAGYPLSTIAIKQHEWVLPYINKLIAFAMRSDQHNAVRRNVMRIFEYISIPRRYHGKVMTMCFNFISSPTEKVAIKAFSLTVLEHMLDEYPAIGSELKVIIEDQWMQQTPAFQSRAKKILLRLKTGRVFNTPPVFP